jgi:hypothetical protein
MVSARLCALSSKIDGQELFPYQTSDWIYLKGRAADFNVLS